MSNERDTWWLVERRGCQLWATGRGSFHSLTNDATRAERFASKFDAEEEIRCAEDHFRDELVAAEHKFIGAVDPEGTNAQLLANALSRAEKAEVMRVVVKLPTAPAQPWRAAKMGEGKQTCETCRNFVLESSYPRKLGTCSIIHGGGGDRHEGTPVIRPVGFAWLQVPKSFGCNFHEPKAPPND